jgi:hypothetical protein
MGPPVSRRICAQRGAGRRSETFDSLVDALLDAACHKSGRRTAGETRYLALLRQDAWKVPPHDYTIPIDEDRRKAEHVGFLINAGKDSGEGLTASGLEVDVMKWLVSVVIYAVTILPNVPRKTI